MKNHHKNLLLFLTSLIFSLALTDGLFRLYERYVLLGGEELIGQQVNLAELNYNDTQVSRNKPANEYRILSFGDSFAYSITKYPWSYHGVAAEILNGASADTTVRIVNLGEPSVSFYQYMQAWRHWAPLIEHDAVIFTIYLGNDLLDVAYHYVPDDAEINRIFGKTGYSLQTGRVLSTRLPRKFPLRMLDYAYAWYHIWKGDIRPSKDTGVGPYNFALVNLDEDMFYSMMLKQMDNFNPEKLQDLKRGYQALAEFIRMVSEIRQSGKQVVVMLAPNEMQVTPHQQQELQRRHDIDLDQYDTELSAYLIQEMVQQVDPEIPVLHLFDTLLCADAEGQDLYYGTNTHWSVAGNHLVGEILGRFIADEWLKQNELRDLSLQPCALQGPARGFAPESTLDRNEMANQFIAPLLRDRE
ncbi:SGNH hydrolase domain-containing protein [Pseudomonadota bacterium]